MNSGDFIISLDFELHWGAVEKWNLDDKKEYFNKTRETIPIVLELFEKYKVHATWATVGFLFAKSKEQLIEFCPHNKPSYGNDELSYYNIIEENKIGDNEVDDPFHFAFSLISKIIDTPFQEIATHTFSHYYCNEKGQNKDQFNEDLKAAQLLAKENFNIVLKSLVFPRNQFNQDYLKIAENNNIKVVRSNPNVWFWNKNTKLTPIARAFDTLMPISKTVSFNLDSFQKDKINLLPASRFLRPFSKNEKAIQSLKLKRVKNEMTYAAKNNKTYHLWWHPHNFGNFPKENLLMLEKILKHYEFLSEKYNFKSKNMIEMVGK
jgi:peptidoglycan/xylan/chitin deacetylase (PgdA/CDA1 family)